MSRAGLRRSAGTSPAFNQVTTCAAGATARSPSTPARNEDRLAPKPRSLSFEEPAALPISGSTALQGIRDAGNARLATRPHSGGQWSPVGRAPLARWDTHSPRSPDPLTLRSPWVTHTRRHGRGPGPPRSRNTQCGPSANSSSRDAEMTPIMSPPRNTATSGLRSRAIIAATSITVSS